jgi:hypothetical protein
VSKQNQIAEIESIEADSFISTAFVENIYLQGISAKTLHTNSFRGLSNCKILDLSSSYVEQIEANAFYRTTNIDLLNLSYTRIRHLNDYAFSGMQNIKYIDLRRNYIQRVNQTAFAQLLVVDDSSLKKAEKIYFENNPIQCDCSLNWILTDHAVLSAVSLPEICAGPRGFDCLSVNEFKQMKRNCSPLSDPNELPCNRLVFPSASNLDESEVEYVVATASDTSSAYDDDPNAGQADSLPATTQAVKKDWDDLTVTFKKPNKNKNTDKDLLQLHITSCSKKNSSGFSVLSIFFFFRLFLLFYSNF